MGKLRLFLLLVSFTTIHADQFDTMMPRTSGTSESLRAVVVGNNTFVAVGENGTILTSTNSLDWHLRSQKAGESLRSVIYADGKFVALGTDAVGASILYASTDRDGWLRTQLPVVHLNAITNGAGVFVAVGAAGAVVISTNAVDWFVQSSGTTNDLNAVTYGTSRFTEGVGPAMFVAVGSRGTIITSNAGKDWFPQPSGTTNDLHAVIATFAHLPGLTPTFAAVGSRGTIITSEDGQLWRSKGVNTTNSLLGISFDRYGNSLDPSENGWAISMSPPGTFGVVGEGGLFLTSSDSLHWTPHPVEATTALNAVAYGLGGFLAVGDSGVIEASTLWQARHSGTSADLFSVFHNGRGWVAFGNDTMLSSTNGVEWSVSASPFPLLYWPSVTHGLDMFVAVGRVGAVFKSGDGITWTKHTIASSPILYSVASGNGRFVALAEVRTSDISSSPQAWVSTNGVDWSVGPTLPIPRIENGSQVSFAKGLFITAAYRSQDAAIFTSPDGLKWDEHPWPGYDLFRFVEGDNQIVGVGKFIDTSGTQIATSPDGTTWTTRNAGSVTCYDVTYGNGGFVGVGFAWGFPPLGPGLVTSSDGVIWTSRGIDLRTNNVTELLPLRSVAYAGGTFVAVGDKGMIVQSIAAPITLEASILGKDLRFSITADPGRSYYVQASADLLKWETGPFATNSVPTQTITIQPTQAHQFFRVVAE